jgi:Raf kinase inhibitor-like YbhB/YbcL family protein
MKITSKAFPNGGNIPEQYTRYGANKIPPLHLEDIPETAQSIALVVDEVVEHPDAPDGTFNHWILFNMDPKTKDIQEDRVPVVVTEGQNDFGDLKYEGPKPPFGEHQYCFKAFALDTVLPLPRGVKRQDLEHKMKDHVLDSAILMGKYAS